MIQTEAFYPSLCNSAICLYTKNGDNYILSDATIKNFKIWFISICSVMSRVKIGVWYIYNDWVIITKKLDIILYVQLQTFQ